MRGKLIVLEGIDGTGKSTQAQLVYKALQRLGKRPLLLKEPTGSDFGRKIREKLKSGGFRDAHEEAMLFTLDRVCDFINNIHPALAEGRVIVMDRYYYSTIAYQGAKGVDTEYLREINEMFAPRPDLLVILDAPPHETLGRIKNHDTFEREEYLEKVRALFLKEAKRPGVLVVNADRDVMSILEDIMIHVKSIL